MGGVAGGGSFLLDFKKERKTCVNKKKGHQDEALQLLEVVDIVSLPKLSSSPNFLSVPQHWFSFTEIQ